MNCPSLLPSRLEIRSDDAEVLSWPWSAVEDPLQGPLGLHAHVSLALNRLDRESEPPAHRRTSGRHLRVLLVILRPYFPNDAPYRLAARPIVDAVRRAGGRVDVLRPPTFSQLRETLRERHAIYDIIHIDGHGAYLPIVAGSRVKPAGRWKNHPRQGLVVFERDEAGAQEVTAELIGDLLRELACVPLVVLNACRSGRSDSHAASVFHSIAASLLKAGARNVVAMQENLLFSAAKLFLPSFYRELCRTGSPAAATLAGRKAMAEQPERDGTFPLQDWLLPVLYGSDEVWLPAGAPKSSQPAATRHCDLTDAPDLPADHVPEDLGIQQLERALLQAQPAILLHGPAGCGKSTLARDLVEWRHDTGGLDGVLWIAPSADETADSILRRISRGFPDAPASSIEVPQHETLGSALRERRILLIWDDFAVEPLDRPAIQRFLRALRGGRTRVLLIGEEAPAWLEEDRVAVPCYGLSPAVHRELALRILRSLGREDEFSTPDFQKLLDLLDDGNPDRLRRVLRQLDGRTVREVRDQFRPE